MRNGKWEIRNKKLLLISCFLLLTWAAACGRRGDPVAIAPYKKVGVVKDLKVLKRDGDTYLRWGMPDEKDFPEKALKGFALFRAEVPEGASVEECDCQHRPLDFIVFDSRLSRHFADESDRTFEYLDKKAVKGQAYAYKLVVMDKNIEPSEKYLYRVTSVSDTESPPSKEISISTETR